MKIRHCVLQNILLLNILLLWIGCEYKAKVVSYNYGGLTYSSEEQALNAQQKDLDFLLNNIPPTNHPVGGTAAVILPSTAHIRKNFVVSNSPPPYRGFLTKVVTDEANKQLTDFVVLLLTRSLQGTADIIDKRRIFDHVNITTSDDPENAVFQENIAIVVLKKDGVVKGFVRKNGSPGNLIPVEEISSALPPIQGGILWLDSVEKISKNFVEQ